LHKQAASSQQTQIMLKTPQKYRRVHTIFCLSLSQEFRDRSYLPKTTMTGMLVFRVLILSPNSENELALSF